MHMYKKTIYISIWVSVISGILALLFWYMETRLCDFLSSVCVGIFCSICIVIVTVYIQYKNEYTRLMSEEEGLLRKLYFLLLSLSEIDVYYISVDMRTDLVNEFDDVFSKLVHTAADMSFMERKNRCIISKISRDIMKMYIPFIDNYKLNPGVALLLLKEPSFMDNIFNDMELVTNGKIGKKIIRILKENRERKDNSGQEE